ncbi:MAG: DUF4375 domain-containing protein [Saprospiraceae bacterium]
MKIKIILLILLMNFFNNIFGQKEQPNDPYWVFEEASHFKPQLSKGDFYKLEGYDFGWFVLEPLSTFIGDRDQEIEKSQSLSFGQKALYYWWYLDGQVTNGGFVQFYYNDYGKYMPTIIKGLEYIGDKEMTKLVKKVHQIYLKNEKLFLKAQEDDLFGSDLYDRLDAMSELDDDYYDLNELTIKKLETFIRKNPNEFCVDESGDAFDMSYSGLCQTFFPNKKIKEEFYLIEGIIDGTFTSYFEIGGLNEKIEYVKGVQTGEKEVYFENGKIKESAKILTDLKQLEITTFYDNGNPKKLQHQKIETEKRIGVYKEWHSNGQLKESGTYISDYERDGEWLEFYEDGSKKMEAEFKNGDFLIHDFWDKDGSHILKNGTGLYINEYSMFKDEQERKEHEYKNYKRHGIQKDFTNGVLNLYQEMENGREHGMSKSYYKNGKLKEETIYEEGIEMSKKEFPLFENPIVVAQIIYEMEDKWLTNRELETADSYPIPLNNEEVENSFKVEVSVFDGYSAEEELFYNYFVTIDENGNITNADFRMASNGFLREEIQESFKQLKFKPAMKDGEAVESYLFMKYEFKLGEDKK